MFFKEKKSLNAVVQDAFAHHVEQSFIALNSVLKAANRTSKDDVRLINEGLPALLSLWVPVICSFGQKNGHSKARKLHADIIRYAGSEIRAHGIADKYQGVKLDWIGAQRIIDGAPGEGVIHYLIEKMLREAYPEFDFRGQEFAGAASLITAFNYVDFLSKKYKLV